MGRIEQTTTTWVCDRCHHKFAHPHHQLSHADLTIRWTATMFGGDVGGTTQTAWLCQVCNEDLRTFLGNHTVERVAEENAG